MPADRRFSCAQSPRRAEVQADGSATCEAVSEPESGALDFQLTRRLQNPSQRPRLEWKCYLQQHKYDQPSSFARMRTDLSRLQFFAMNVSALSALVSCLTPFLLSKPPSSQMATRVWRPAPDQRRRYHHSRRQRRNLQPQIDPKELEDPLPLQDNLGLRSHYSLVLGVWPGRA